MTPDESLKICRLAKALSPAQAVDEYTPDAWAVVLRNIRYVDAENALEQLGAEQEWIHVSHIVRRVRKIRSERVGRHLANAQPPSGLDAAGYDAWYRRTIRAIGDGDYEPEPPVAIEGRDVIRELGQVGQSVEAALAVRPLREAHVKARRELQAAEADRKREREERQAELDRMRAADREARANQTAQAEEPSDA